jgi:hypothetical protein
MSVRIFIMIVIRTAARQVDGVGLNGPGSAAIVNDDGRIHGIEQRRILLVGTCGP